MRYDDASPISLAHVGQNRLNGAEDPIERHIDDTSPLGERDVEEPRRLETLHRGRDRMTSLTGKISVVTGASRGIGKGIAAALGSCGATVYVTGRTAAVGEHELPGTIGETAAEVTRRGGTGIAVQTDHADDGQVAELFDRIRVEQGRLDILVNNAFALPDDLTEPKPFWEKPLSNWEMVDVGVRSNFTAARLAAQIMVPQGSGLIVATSGYVGVTYTYGVVFGLCKTAVDRMARDIAIELQPHGVASLSLWQGLTMTERAQRNLSAHPEMTKSIVTRPAVGCSPEFPGRVIAALATDPDLMNLSGGTFITAELAQRYGITDIDGKTVPSLRAERGSPIWQPITGAERGH
jgi:NAD(P)-dependent dehydrogenase (short-subunit alcohol dehydrogenase family)